MCDIYNKNEGTNPDLGYDHVCRTCGQVFRNTTHCLPLTERFCSDTCASQFSHRQAWFVPLFPQEVSPIPCGCWWRLNEYRRSPCSLTMGESWSSMDRLNSKSVRSCISISLKYRSLPLNISQRTPSWRPLCLKSLISSTEECHECHRRPLMWRVFGDFLILHLIRWY